MRGQRIGIERADSLLSWRVFIEKESVPYANIKDPEMTARMDRCVEKVMASGKPKDSAIAICYASMTGTHDRNALREMFAVPDDLAGYLATLNHPDHSERIAIDEFMAADFAKPFRLLPLGKFYRGERILEIDEKRAREIEENFKKNLPRFGISVNVEHGDSDQLGAVGSVKNIFYKPGDGVWADRVEFTDAGKKLLDENRFRAVSPEIVWSLNEGAKYQDPETGTWHDNVLVGLALTTAPFFGNRVAIFSAKPKEKFMNADLLEQMKEMLKKMFALLQGETEVPPADKEEPMTAITAAEFNAAKKLVEKLTAQQETAERFALEMQAKLEVEQAAAKKLAEAFAVERQLRRTAEFREIAETFRAIPAEPADLGKRLLWLQDADATVGKENYEFFAALLKAVDQGLTQSALFTSIGSGRVANGDGVHPFLTAVEKIRVERFGKEPYANGFTEAFKLAEQEHKDLAKQYVMDKRAARA